MCTHLIWHADTKKAEEGDGERGSRAVVGGNQRLLLCGG
ncbi:unnamed protein product [Urochloa humidicola]